MRAACLSNLFVAMAVAPAVVFAHHGAPGYDFSKPLTFEGKVVEVDWKNPHVYFTIEAAGADGNPRRLEFEAASLSAVGAFGLRREMLPVGAHVKVLAFGKIGHPENIHLKGGAVTLDDGSVHLLDNSPVPSTVRATVAAQALAGKWVPASSRSFLDYTEAERRARATPRAGTAEGPPKAGVVPLATSCAALAKGSPPLVTAAIHVLRTIELGEKRVVMRIDADGFVLERVVHLDQATHPVNVAHTLLGHSIGRWEGKTLVIDTAAFAPNPALNQSARKHLVERLTLTEDHRQIRYELTVEDPDYFGQPFEYSMLWDHRPDLEFSGAACDEQNARRYLTGQ